MVSRQSPYYKRYGFAVLAVTAAFILRLLLEHYITRGSHILFSTIILLTSYFVGRGPGICATLLAAPFAEYFLSSNGIFNSQSEAVMQTIIYTIEGLIVAFIADGIAVSKFEIEKSLKELKKERFLIERYVATFSHDLKNPLTAAKLKLNILLRNLNHKKEENPGAIYEKLMKVLDRADQMVENMLDASLLRNGKTLTLHLKESDLNAIVREAVDEMTALPEKKFELSLENNPIKVLLDPSSLRRAIDNLLTNAIKYRDPGTPISISTEVKQDKALVTIHNYGPTISKKEQRLLFEPFYRSSIARNGDQKGWGLGLALVQGVVAAHKGNIKVESEENSGTSFTIEIPLNN